MLADYSLALKLAVAGNCPVVTACTGGNCQLPFKKGQCCETAALSEAALPIAGFLGWIWYLLAPSPVQLEIHV